jgi:riboflavin kinase / FMN adenylyltransferase
MELLRGPGLRPQWEAAAVAIGNFDGVHLGHRALLECAIARAKALGGPSIAVTFDPHPTSVLAPHLAPPLLTTLERRLQLLAATGIDVAVVMQFTAELAAMPAQEFVEQVLRRELAARHVVVGYDFSYGRGRGGSTSTLQAHGAQAGFGVDVIGAVELAGAGGPGAPGAREIASSTRIRGHLRSGNLTRALQLLGHGYDVDGVVVHGAKRGRLLGFPTANVRPEVDLIAGTGIYAVRFAVYDEGAVAPAPETLTGTLVSAPPPQLLSASLPAVASLGTNPTFVDSGARTLEVYVLDFAGDLYDRRVRVELVEKLRDEAKFDSIEALVAQIEDDVTAARRVLGA